jgi:hypothetical protein
MWFEVVTTLKIHIRVFGLWRHVVLKAVTKILEEHAATIFRVEICLD